MAIDRQGTGLSMLRICIGIFFIFEGVAKIGWFTDTSVLATQLAGWAQSAPAGSWSHLYLAKVALPYSTIFARLVPLGELASGVAMVAGIWTPLFAFVAFFMALNFQIASGALFQFKAMTNPYVFPVLGATLALAIGGVRLPWSIRSARPVRAIKAKSN